jgi:hypothetical protein
MALTDESTYEQQRRNDPLSLRFAYSSHLMNSTGKQQQQLQVYSQPAINFYISPLVLIANTKAPAGSDNEFPLRLCVGA